ncbi:MAG: hypothetical protein D3926_19460 [Desulfobacteraceae bacterium]|nr:MAG: hypothetical protein D3926_19460 [Desulfobacteraceae bacterium]
MIIFLLIFPLGIILALPLLGIIVSGSDAAFYLEFPPKPVITSHAPFSWPVLIVICLFVLMVTLPFVRQGLKWKRIEPPSAAGRFPWWGYGSVGALVLFWILAWTRLHGFAPFQHHTFFPLWFCWIVCVNALTFRRSGRCPMIDSPIRFTGLFAVSALFWWMFEYLNRFVGNWYYTGSEYPAVTYFLLATLSFSTVLPAVESMKTYLMTHDTFKNGFQNMPRIQGLDSKPAAVCILVISFLCLGLIGILPDPLFFTLWISPFFLLLGFRILCNHPHVFGGVKGGDYTMVVSYAFAALICGIFWEMFNFYSLARWQYTIPYVQVCHLFEMPILGYSGYLPFGLECALVIDLVQQATDRAGSI